MFKYVNNRNNQLVVTSLYSENCIVYTTLWTFRQFAPDAHKKSWNMIVHSQIVIIAKLNNKSNCKCTFSYNYDIATYSEKKQQMRQKISN